MSTRTLNRKNSQKSLFHWRFVWNWFQVATHGVFKEYLKKQNLSIEDLVKTYWKIRLICNSLKRPLCCFNHHLQRLWSEQNLWLIFKNNFHLKLLFLSVLSKWGGHLRSGNPRSRSGITWRRSVSRASGTPNPDWRNMLLLLLSLLLLLLWGLFLDEFSVGQNVRYYCF